MLYTEKFILEIEKRPVIYDVQSEDYGNRMLRAASWNEVGEVMYDSWGHMTQAERDATVKEMVKKWKTVRDNFVREVKMRRRSEMRGSKVKKRKYLFYDQLAFLIPYLKICDTGVSLKAEDEEEDDGAEPQAQHNYPPVRLRAAVAQRRLRGRPRKTPTIDRTFTLVPPPSRDTDRESLTPHSDGSDSDRFGNKAFLLSYLPLMDSLSPHKSLDVRVQITEVFRNAMMTTAPYHVPTAAKHFLEAEDIVGVADPGDHPSRQYDVEVTDT
uniref:MADF domain-containing protein n=1 Tax=Graphocephala atropunctata TaxID=36148 RepID=A0A1B6LDQ9_9HEMI